MPAALWKEVLRRDGSRGWICTHRSTRTIADAAVAIQKHRRGRPVIGVLPAYFPLELIHAAGGDPVQLWGAGGEGGHADAYLQPYCCSVSRSALESAMRAADTFIQAYVFTTLCDTLINLRELYRRLFAQPILGLFIPITPSPVERRRLLSEEVAQLLSGLEALFVENATDFAASRVEVTATYDAERITVEVSDDGPGFAPDVIVRLGEPYVTSRPAGEDSPSVHEGMGLGFFIAKTLMERSGAKVTFGNARKGGATVQARWKRARLEVEPRDSASGLEAGSARTT